MMRAHESQMEALLRGSIEISRLKAENRTLRESNERLLARLNQRMDEYNAASDVSCLLRPQAG